VGFGMNINEIIENIGAYTGITKDSREVGPGYIFGSDAIEEEKRQRYIKHAILNGATVILGETPPEMELSVPFVKVNELMRAIGDIACRMYHSPSSELLLIGITGTCGKTSVSYLMESILRADGYEVGVIGSIAWRYRDVSLPATHTTPEAHKLQSVLRDMKDAGCTAVVMEVSSHGLKLDRVAFVAFDAMAFTNLSPEHLDFHENMADYFDAKALLFSKCALESADEGKQPVAAINVDDCYGKELVTRIKKSGEIDKLVTYGITEGDVLGDGLHVEASGIQGVVNDVKVESKLVGRFNVENILCAIALSRALGIPASSIEVGVRSLKAIPGRLERIDSASGVHAFVDHAHKVGALRSVLEALRDLRGEGKLIVVFGCGGLRDKFKRPAMGKVACEMADTVWLTSDNPRTENPLAIISEIRAGIPAGCDVREECDREEAIRRAVAGAKRGDILVVAGRGHETHQIVASESSSGQMRKIPLNDSEVLRRFLNGSGDIA
jgi:UDP-N-acetylmuramoyl-L-alanyl-D-glutamate--2,6-diaminopimelate ligase